MMRGDVEKMKKRKILALGILIMLVCSVGLIIAQENLVKTKKQVNGHDNIRLRLNNSELAEILERHGMYMDTETGLFKIKTEGGIPEAGITGAELKEMLERANLNYKDPITGEINFTKLAKFDPVEEVVKRLKGRGYNDSEIIEILRKHGMIWDPETECTAIGLTSEDLGFKRLPKLYNPVDNKTFVESSSTQAYQLMEVSNDVYRGFRNLMKPGSCAAEEGGTTDHVVTTHMGAEGYWTEVGVYKDTEPTLWIFSYDNDEGGYNWHGTTSPSVYSKYEIYVTNFTPDGWEYEIYINGDFKRRGHLPQVPPTGFPLYDVNEANEIWYDTGWTPDTSRAIFICPRLIDQNLNEIWWDENVETSWRHNFWPPYPVKEFHGIMECCEYKDHAFLYETWVE